MTTSSASRKTIGVVLKGYPRLSETFIAQELHALERRGISLELFSLRRPTDRATHPIHAAIQAPVNYLPEYLHHEPARVWRGWSMARTLPGYGKAHAAWRRDLARDFTRNRVRRFGQGLVLAAELPEHVMHLHAHFLHTPASVTRYAALARSLSWSVSAHAKDIWTTPDWEKREKLADCAWATTCTAANAKHLRALAQSDAFVALIYHGIDSERFPTPAPRASIRDGHEAADPVRILTIGRAVEKKGFDDLLRALARVPPDRHWQLVHIGDGPLLNALRTLARQLRIEDRIQWRGPQAHEAVLAAYRDSDMFALACRVGENGDRDGLPNVLLEAQSQRLACVSTRISGIPELIENQVTGLLVEPGDIDALARALTRLIADPALRGSLGDAGLHLTSRDFSLDAGAERLAVKLRANVG